MLVYARQSGSFCMRSVLTESAYESGTMDMSKIIDQASRSTYRERTAAMTACKLSVDTVAPTRTVLFSLNHKNDVG